MRSDSPSTSSSGRLTGVPYERMSGMVQIPRYIKVEVTGCMGMSARGPDLHIITSKSAPRQLFLHSPLHAAQCRHSADTTRRVPLLRGETGAKQRSHSSPLTPGARRAVRGPDARATTILKSRASLGRVRLITPLYLITSARSTAQGD